MDERKHLTQIEVERLITATKGSRNEARDRCDVGDLPVAPASEARATQGDCGRRDERSHALTRNAEAVGE